MRRFLAALLGMAIGYPVAAFGGYWAIELLSDNHFDRGVEASMTALFVIGPLARSLAPWWDCFQEGHAIP